MKECLEALKWGIEVIEGLYSSVCEEESLTQTQATINAFIPSKKGGQNRSAFTAGSSFAASQSVWGGSPSHNPGVYTELSKQA